MHDIDRAMFELEHEGDREAYESNEMFESYETFEGFETSGEAQELELAAELLEVTNEQELDRFLGNLISSAASAVGNFAKSDTGRALGGLLKSTARRALPQVGRIVGDFVAPGTGGNIGAQAGKWLGKQFEMEGLSAEDRELEVARSFVRFGQEAARQAARPGQTSSPAAAAQRAAVAAAQQHVPGLASVLAGARPVGPGTGHRRRARSGRWVRQPNGVVLIGF